MATTRKRNRVKAAWLNLCTYCPCEQVVYLHVKRGGCNPSWWRLAGESRQMAIDVIAGAVPVWAFCDFLEDHPWELDSAFGADMADGLNWLRSQDHTFRIEVREEVFIDGRVDFITRTN